MSTFETLRNPHQKILYILCAFFLSFFRRRARLCRHVCRERCSIFGDARSRGQREESARDARWWEERLETNDSEKKINVVVVVVVVGNGGR